MGQPTHMPGLPAPPLAEGDKSGSQGWPWQRPCCTWGSGRMGAARLTLNEHLAAGWPAVAGFLMPTEPPPSSFCPAPNGSEPQPSGAGALGLFLLEGEEWAL